MRQATPANRFVIQDLNAPPLWARFYEIDFSGHPFFCGRDGVKKHHLAEIEAERRNCSSYGQWGKKVAALYDKCMNK